MMKQQQRKYETPQTTFMEVELEQGFMKGSFDGDKIGSGSLNISEQTKELYIDFAPDSDGSNNFWDSEKTN